MRGEVACGTPLGLPGFSLSLGAAAGPALSAPAAPAGSEPLGVCVGGGCLPGRASLGRGCRHTAPGPGRLAARRARTELRQPQLSPAQRSKWETSQGTPVVLDRSVVLQDRASPV